MKDLELIRYQLNLCGVFSTFPPATQVVEFVWNQPAGQV